MSVRVLSVFFVCLLALRVSVAEAVECRMEKLGRLPVAVLRSPDDLNLWTSESLKEAEASGYAVDIISCKESVDGSHVAAVVPKPGGKCCVWLDGKEGDVYDQVRGEVRGAYKEREFHFSPDGSRLAYTAKKGNKWVMVVDGKPGKEYEGMREPYFSPDGKHIAYVAFEGKDCVLVVDGKECGRYPEIKMGFRSYRSKYPVRIVDDVCCPVVFGPSGRFAFIASKGRGKNGGEREIAVIDGKESPEYEAIYSIEFSPDGSRIAYVASKAGKQFVVVDGKPWAKYDEVHDPLTFSPDGKRLACVVLNYDSNGNGTYCVLVDGNPGPKFKDIFTNSLMFSADGKHIAYTASADGEHYCVVVDGKPGPAYEEIGGYGGGMSSAHQMFGPNGEVVYRARRAGKYYMVIGGKSSAAYDDIPDPFPVFSADGKHYAFRVQQGEKWSVVLDGVQGRDYQLVGHDSVMFTGDGRLVYSASKPDAFLTVIDGKEYVDMFHPVFSPDGKHIAYQHRSEEDWLNPHVVIVDGQKAGSFAWVLTPRFLQDGSLEFLAVRDESTGTKMIKNLYRVSVTP